MVERNTLLAIEDITQKLALGENEEAELSCRQQQQQVSSDSLNYAWLLYFEAVAVSRQNRKEAYDKILMAHHHAMRQYCFELRVHTLLKLTLHNLFADIKKNLCLLKNFQETLDSWKIDLNPGEIALGHTNYALAILGDAVFNRL